MRNKDKLIETTPSPNPFSQAQLHSWPLYFPCKWCRRMGREGLGSAHSVPLYHSFLLTLLLCSSMGPSHRLQSFTNCSNMSLQHGLKFFRKNPLQHVSPQAAGSFRAHPPAPASGPPWAVVWASAPTWSSTGCRERNTCFIMVSPWTMGESLLRHLEHLLPFLHWPWVS